MDANISPKEEGRCDWCKKDDSLTLYSHMGVGKPIKCIWLCNSCLQKIQADSSEVEKVP